MSKQAIRLVWDLMDAGVRLGTFPAFARILGAHVLHRMTKEESLVIGASLHDLFGVVLTDRENRPLAGALETVVHEGEGHVVGERGISLRYIAALQMLQGTGLILTELAEPPKRPMPAIGRDGHFTFWPGLLEGRDWTEQSSLIWSLSGDPSERTIARFAAVCDPTNGQREELASFL
jgi:hypothetical protein